MTAQEMGSGSSGGVQQQRPLGTVLVSAIEGSERYSASRLSWRRPRRPRLRPSTAQARA